MAQRRQRLQKGTIPPVQYMYFSTVDTDFSSQIVLLTSLLQHLVESCSSVPESLAIGEKHHSLVVRVIFTSIDQLLARGIVMGSTIQLFNSR